MRKLQILIGLSLMALLVLTTPGLGQDKIAQTGFKWLSIPIGARAASLGSAFTAVIPDAGSAFHNPAGLALVEGKHVFLNQTQWIADIDINAFAFSFNAGNLGAFGVHAMAVSWGTFHGTQFSTGGQLYEETGEFSPDDFAIGVSYARRVSDKFSFGGTVRFLHENLGSGFEGSFDDPEKYNAAMNVVALDFGTLFYTGFKDLRLGMTIQNVSQEKEYRFESFPLPLTFKFGVAMDVSQIFMNGEKHQSLTLSCDALHPRDFSERLHVGLEYGFRDMIFLRGGYKTNYDEEDLTFGGGLQLSVSNLDFGVDYSYLRFDNFDAVHMFSFDFGF